MLDEIIYRKKREVDQRQQAAPLARLEADIARRGPTIDFARALRGDSIRLIAEVKRASPSRGVLCPDFDPVAIAGEYARSGAAAISVLTEKNYFHGDIDYLAAIRETVRLPLLRKDFIFDPYQVYESRAYGADALLLIVAVLRPPQLAELVALSHRLGLQCLVEVHTPDEVAVALGCGAKIIGINNRDLKTFNIDLDTTRRLRAMIPQELVVVSESGIHSPQDVSRVREWGVDAILVGEALVTADSISAKIKELVP